MAQLCAGLVRTHNHKLNYLNSRQCQTFQKYQFVDWIFSKLLEKKNPLLCSCCDNVKLLTKTRWLNTQPVQEKELPHEDGIREFKKNKPTSRTFLSFEVVLPAQVIWFTRAHRGPAAESTVLAYSQRLYVWKICMRSESASNRSSWLKQEHNRGLVREVNWNAGHHLNWQGFVPSSILDGIYCAKASNNKVRSQHINSEKTLQDPYRCMLLLYESGTASLQESAVTQQSSVTFSSLPP